MSKAYSDPRYTSKGITCWNEGASVDGCDHKRRDNCYVIVRVKGKMMHVPICSFSAKSTIKFFNAAEFS